MQNRYNQSSTKGSELMEFLTSIHFSRVMEVAYIAMMIATMMMSSQGRSGLESQVW